MRKLALLVVATATAMIASTGLVGVAAADAPPHRPGVTVAAGLNNPRQLTFDYQGNLYVAEAGTGQLNATDQSGTCGPGPEGESCAGNTSSITKHQESWRARPTPGGSSAGLLSFAGP